MTTFYHAWCSNANILSTAKVRLFCFPYAGGGASVYRDWTEFFHEDMEVCPVQLPGRESRWQEPPMAAVQQIVSAFMAEIEPLLHKPFAFFGHSMGAMIAYEAALAARERYGKQPVHLFVSGQSAPGYRMTRKNRSHLPDAEFKLELLRMNGTPPEVLQHEELMAMLMPRIRADFAVCEQYMPTKAAQPLTCPITVFGGTEDYEVSLESLKAWRERSLGEFDLHLLEGDHFFLNTVRERGRILHVLQDTLLHTASITEPVHVRTG
ncbi:thioesterase II family protein [Paenibacillus puerhi]|uniref:thioesterase II family protein n=1 Tax=Paenibacillus puerhi TaxID=2692622 RepID=UPI00135C87DE|nr:alpha/beta fold hydrolase [Paenibacillus puerhi]